MVFVILHLFFIGLHAKFVSKDSIFSPEVHDDGVILFVKTSSIDNEGLSLSLVYFTEVFWVISSWTAPETISTIIGDQ